MSFDPNAHVIQLKSKQGSQDYLPVAWRIVWFREQCPQGTIETELVQLDLDRETEEEAYVWNNETRRSEKIMKRANGFALFRATVKDGKGGVATGTKSEKAASFPDFIEKSETGSIGRALAALGYGTQFAPELNEEHRIVDAPVERTSSNGNERSPLASVRPATTPQGRQGTDETVKPPIHAQNTQPSQETHPDATPAIPMATEQQLSSIRKLCQHLGKNDPEDLDSASYQDAKELIATLSLEYRQSRQRAS